MIEVKHLTKKYGSQVAVNDLSFTIEKGQIYGLLGPNGAGKTTTMNIMTGCLAATAGEVKINGYDIFEDALQAKKLIGYLPEQPPLYMDRTPREYLRFVGRAKGIPEKKLGEQIDRAMEATQITAMADRLIKNLSKGYKQRVGIAQALLGDPEVVILDEPTVGLDPHQIIEIRDLIMKLGKKRTVILSSHILSEVQAVCQTILIISKGRLVACDTPENLERLMAGTATVNLTAECSEAQAKRLLAQIEDITQIQTLSGKKDRCSLRLGTDQTEGDGVCRKLFFAFAQAGLPILEMSVAKASLEQVFIELTSNAAQPQKEPEKAEEPEEEEQELSQTPEEGENTLETELPHPVLEELEIDPETLDIAGNAENKEADEK
ncbi:MAG: ABC transporter ATP-binding protein [Oscillospiraceae bacterium]|nr:ABC transporter ATP-binding protein [Oscillospiraceae bacterium]